MTRHTPTPWRLSPESPRIIKPDYSRCLIASAMGHPNSGFYPSDEEADANAAFIVVACNAHDELVATLSRLVAESTHHDGAEYEDGEWLALDAARAALAKAGAA